MQKETHTRPRIFRNGIETRTTFVCVCGGTMHMTLLINKGFFYPPDGIGSLTTDQGEHAFLTGVMVTCNSCHAVAPVPTFWKH